MTFALPTLLWALPVAATPLLLHLIFRRKAKRMLFSDLTFLKKIYAKIRPLTKIRQWLLVAARCLILLCLVLAYAGPILEAQPRTPGAGGAAGAGLDLVVMLDTSYSMGYHQEGKTRLALAQQAAQTLMRRLQPSDRAAVIFFSDHPEFPGGKIDWMAPEQALEIVSRGRLSSRGTDYARAFNAASQFLAKDASGRRKAVLVLSDGCRHGLRTPLPASDPNILWLGLSWPKASGNSYLASVGPASQGSGREPALLVQAAGLGSKTGDIPLELWLNGRHWQDAALSSSLPTASLITVLPQTEEAKNSTWWGRANLRPDALSSDDSYFFSFRLPKKPRVLCLYSSGDFLKAPHGGYFLRELLGGVQGSLLNFDSDFLDLNRLEDARLKDYQAVILAGFGKISPIATAALESFVSEGGGLLVIPDAQTDSASLSSLQTRLCANFGLMVSAEGRGIKVGPAGNPKLWNGFDLRQVEVSQYYLLQTKPGSKILFQSPSGYPLLVWGKYGLGRTAVWAASLDASASNLALKPIFAAWTQNVLESLLPEIGSRNENMDIAVGSPIIRTWGPDEAAPASVRLKDPQGHSSMLWLKNRQVKFDGTDEPGLYTLSEESGDKDEIYAVNLDRSSGESDLTPLSRPPWKEIRINNLDLDFELAVYGKNARDTILAAAVAFLALEMFLSLGPQGAAVILFCLLLARPAAAQQGDRFVWSQLKLGQSWDPYPEVYQQILEFTSSITSILVEPKRRVLALDDPELFSSPMIILAGREAPPELSPTQQQNLRNYLNAGGLLWIEDISGSEVSSFDRWVRGTLAQTLPDSQLKDLEPDHVLFKTFFLLRGAAGRIMIRGALEGVSLEGRTAVIYSRNDILGAWAKDPLGKPLYPCLPGGEPQCQNAKKLTLNIIMYSLTGNYKSDAVHQPYLLQKMRSGIP